MAEPKETQLKLFTVEPHGLTLREAAQRLSVSQATIRNWIHSGLLNTVDGKLLQSDVDTFALAQLHNKLKSRANKLRKDSHDQSELSETICGYIQSNELSGEEIALKYESSLSESFKNKEGVFYTPPYIVADMMDDISGTCGKTFLDPCCGSGNFIMEAIRKGFAPESVFGYDTDENAVAITKKRIFDATGYNSSNIVCGDFLKSANTISRRFDCIFTNPPWGKKIPKCVKDNYAAVYKAGNSNDTCSLFYFASLSLLKSDGRMGLLLPDAFFNIGTFEEARKSLLSSCEILRLIDYQRPFKSLLTKAKAFVMAKEKQADFGFVNCGIYNQEKFIRSQRGFLSLPKHILNFGISEEENDVVRHVYSLSHITLKDNATWALGIVTGNNEKFCKKNREKDTVPVFRGKDIFPDHVAESGLFIDKSLKNCQQVAPRECYDASEKVLYRFISNRIICFYDTEQRYILNSANLFILKPSFPISYKNIVALLNSDFMNWLFQSVFCTHKILRGDLEELPIWTDYFEQYAFFSEETLLEFLKIEKKNGTYCVKK